MQVGAGLSVVGILFTFLQRDEIRDQLAEDADPPMTSDELDTAVAAGLGFAVVIGVLAAALWLWMAHTNGQGKTWARTTATVLGGLNVLFTLIGVAMGQATGLSIVTSFLGLALAVTILILLYRPDANRFYDVTSGRTGY
jgi:hypothetical protein